MRCSTPPSIHVIKSGLNKIGLTVDELRAFGEITSKPRLLMNINEIHTKTNRDRLLIMGNLPSKYENGRPLQCWLRVVTSIQQRNIDLAPPSWIFMRCNTSLTYLCSPLPANVTNQAWTKSNLRLPNYAHFKKSLLSPAHSWILMKWAPKTIGTIYPLGAIHHPSMRMVGPCVVDLEWLQAFNSEM